MPMAIADALRPCLADALMPCLDALPCVLALMPCLAIFVITLLCHFWCSLFLWHQKKGSR